MTPEGIEEDHAMTDEMIEQMARAMKPALFQLYPAGKSAAHEEARNLARAAAAPLESRVRELEEALRQIGYEAEPEPDDLRMIARKLVGPAALASAQGGDRP